MGQIVHAAPPAGAQPGSKPMSTMARVLVVDANPHALAAIERTLRTEGYVIATAFDAAGAVIVADRLGPFELLITALQMAPVDGVELAHLLREQEPDLQVLYVTNCRDELFARSRPHASDDDVIEHPFSEDELVDAVSSLLYWHRRPRRRP